jgi:hypothetical protein
MENTKPDPMSSLQAAFFLLGLHLTVEHLVQRYGAMHDLPAEVTYTEFQLSDMCAPDDHHPNTWSVLFSYHISLCGVVSDYSNPEIILSYFPNPYGTKQDVCEKYDFDFLNRSVQSVFKDALFQLYLQTPPGQLALNSKKRSPASGKKGRANVRVR